MNDNITISTFQLFRLFPDSESARLYLVAEEAWLESASPVVWIQTA